MAKTRKNKVSKRKATSKKSKLSPALKSWKERVMEVFREMRKKNPKYSLGEAMKEAKKRGT